MYFCMKDSTVDVKPFAVTVKLKVPLEINFWLRLGMTSAPETPEYLTLVNYS